VNLAAELIVQAVTSCVCLLTGVSKVSTTVLVISLAVTSRLFVFIVKLFNFFVLFASRYIHSGEIKIYIKDLQQLSGPVAVCCFQLGLKAINEDYCNE